MTKLGWTLVGLVVVGGVALAVKGSEARTLELDEPFRAGGRRRARVLSSINVRTAPRSSAPPVARNDAFAGAVVEVLETGIPSTEPVSREWWRVVTPGGSEGFASAVGARGEMNLEMA